ncbi:MAG TPA: hypothetical protein VF450_13210 [Noviherbaspirillum sp.]
MTQFKKVFLRWLALLAVAVALLSTWLFVGYFHSYRDEEAGTHFFLKAVPTFRIEFYNPDAGESDYESFGRLSTKKQQALLDYCHYRYGLGPGEHEIEICRK